MHPFRPFLPLGSPVLKNNAQLHDWLLAKLINAEKGAMYAKDFKSAMDRTRAKMLEMWESAGLLKAKTRIGSFRERATLHDMSSHSLTTVQARVAADQAC